MNPSQDDIPPGALPLDADGRQQAQLLHEALAMLDGLRERRQRQGIFAPTPQALIDAALQAPPASGGDATEVLARLLEFAAAGIDKSHAGDLAYIPSGGLYSSAVASLLAAGIHAFTGAAFESPALVALEESVLRWLCGAFGLPQHAEGVLLSGGSMANQAAIVCARDRGFDAATSRIYLSANAHHSLHKALHLSGIPGHCIRSVATDDAGAIDCAALEALLREDRNAGATPWMLVGVAGSTDTGMVDDLEQLARLRDQTGAWLHVDGAYGGMFVLTARGRARLRGIERADSITVDAHKGLMLPYGAGALLVRHAGALAHSHTGSGSYMRDVRGAAGLPHYFERGPELTRPFRGLQVWLPLQLHGVEAFAQALDQCLDLALEAEARLRRLPGIAVYGRPVLSIVAFRALAGEAATESLLQRLNSSPDLRVSSTSIGGLSWIRLVFLSQRVSRAQIDRVIDHIQHASANPGMLSAP